MHNKNVSFDNSYDLRSETCCNQNWINAWIILALVFDYVFVGAKTVERRKKAYGWNERHKKFNKCLPQHIKLNIYLHLKRAEKKSGQALNTLVLCCVYAWSSVLIQRKKISMLFALHIAKTLQKLKRSHKIMVR